MTNKLGKFLGAASLGIAFLLTTSLVTPAFGASRVMAKIPFAFQVETKSMPSGTYEFVINQGNEVVDVFGQGSVKGSSALTRVITTMAAQPHSTTDHAHIVFDKVGNTYTLSEVWEPNQEGFLLHVTKGIHEHHVVHADRSSVPQS